MALRRIHIPVAKYYPKERLIEIEADLAEIHWAYAKLLAKRYGKRRRTDFPEPDEHDVRSKIDGVIGQRMMQALLNEWRVPYIHDELCFAFREHRVFHDFIIYNFEEERPISLEIKTFGKHDRWLVVKQALWELEKETGLPDYVIALRLKSDSVAKIEGWLYGYEVEKLPNNPRVCRYAPCHCCRFEELHDFKEIEGKLKACSIKI